MEWKCTTNKWNKMNWTCFGLIFLLTDCATSNVLHGNLDYFCPQSPATHDLCTPMQIFTIFYFLNDIDGDDDDDYGDDDDNYGDDDDDKIAVNRVPSLLQRIWTTMTVQWYCWLRTKMIAKFEFSICLL